MIKISWIAQSCAICQFLQDVQKWGKKLSNSVKNLYNKSIEGWTENIRLERIV